MNKDQAALVRAQGNANETAGQVAGNERLEAERKGDKTAGALQGLAGDVKDAAKPVAKKS